MKTMNSEYGISWHGMTRDQQRDVSTADLPISRRVFSALFAANLFFVGDFADLSAEQMLRRTRIGQAGLLELRERLHESFGWWLWGTIPEVVVPTREEPWRGAHWNGRPGPLWPKLQLGPCWLYFVRSDRFLKIGVTGRGLLSRFRSMQTANPHRLKLWLAVSANDFVVAERQERELHRRFRADRVRGEWFHLGPSLVAYVREQRRISQQESINGAAA